MRATLAAQRLNLHQGLNMTHEHLLLLVLIPERVAARVLIVTSLRPAPQQRQLKQTAVHAVANVWGNAWGGDGGPGGSPVNQRLQALKSRLVAGFSGTVLADFW
ncbi:hypothetical protein [Pseudomonas aegrilactucae]|uniref:Uncharacterized protein n=1 Tax=Pseudomonas aegrilactucae TaxID=2854028 RepID=A0A9Q2XGL6_9PSED|nr:hypothetical protein [Pseudomonas aegrilactucae]MBV6286681.1 hypothetical protein [Pseudomonas aegrilactucae]